MTGADIQQTEAMRLRVFVATPLPGLTGLLESLGYELLTEGIAVADAASVIARTRPDVALVGPGRDADQELELISAITQVAICPVIAVLPDHDAAWVEQAARRGIFAYIVGLSANSFEGSIAVAVIRFREYARLQGRVDHHDTALKHQFELLRSKQGLLLRVQDGILQQLTTASIDLQAGRLEGALMATGTAIEQAKALITDTIEELLVGGSTLDDVLRDSVPTT
jgi:AmiR/NasT family two-component response regulator